MVASAPSSRLGVLPNGHSLLLMGNLGSRSLAAFTSSEDSSSLRRSMSKTWKGRHLLRLRAALSSARYPSLPNISTHPVGRRRGISRIAHSYVRLKCRNDADPRDEKCCSALTTIRHVARPEAVAQSAFFENDADQMGPYFLFPQLRPFAEGAAILVRRSRPLFLSRLTPINRGAYRAPIPNDSPSRNRKDEPIDAGHASLPLNLHSVGGGFGSVNLPPCCSPPLVDTIRFAPLLPYPGLLRRRICQRDTDSACLTLGGCKEFRRGRNRPRTQQFPSCCHNRGASFLRRHHILISVGGRIGILVSQAAA